MARLEGWVGLALAVVAASCVAADSVDATRLRGAVFDPLADLVSVSAAAENASALPADRDFEFPADFQLDMPFTISLSSHESVLVPLAPIRSKLFGERDADIAIGFELNACRRKVLTTLVMESGASHRVSSSDYHCATIVKAEAATRYADLCPLVHGDRDLAIHKDPTQVKGFILRAFESAEVVALLRSTKDHGAYNKAFFVDGDPVQAAESRQLNVSFSAKATQLSFHSARVWQPNTTVAPTNATCEGCEYAVHAEMVPADNSSGVLPQRPPPPYCVARSGSLAYKLPTLTSGASQHVTLPTSFGDLFSISGDYRFVLVASIPSSVNNGHPAMFSYAATLVKITAPTHYTSHILIILGVIAVVAFLTIVAVKAELPYRLLGSRSSSDELPHDDESVRLLAQVIAEQDAQDSPHGEEGDLDNRNTEEERKSESLLDVIRKTKALEATPQSSPRTPPVAHLDGYHEIN